MVKYKMPEQPPSTPPSVCRVEAPQEREQCGWLSLQPCFKAPSAHRPPQSSRRFLLCQQEYWVGSQESAPPLLPRTSGAALCMVRLLAEQFWKAFGEALTFWVKELFWPQSLQMFFHQDTCTCLAFLSDRGYMKRGCYICTLPARCEGTIG